MSRKETRARARLRRLGEAFVQARFDDAKAARTPPTGSVKPDHGRQEHLLRAIERSGLAVWDVARAVDCTEDERAMIAQAVDPRLAGRVRRAEQRKREREGLEGREYQVSGVTPRN